MSLLGTYYAPRIRVPQMIQRNKNQVVQLIIYRDGAEVTPTSATYQLMNEDGTDVITTSAATITGNKIQYTIQSTVVPETMDLSDGLFEIWEVEIFGVFYTFQRPAYLCRRPLYPVISDIDLEATYSDLENLLPSGNTDGWQKWIDEAWVRIVERLRQQGNLPYLITDPQSLRAAHLDLALALVWRNMHSSLGQSNGRYLDLYKEHIKSYEFQWKQISFRYDMDQDGQPDDVNKRRAAYPMISTTNPPSRFSRIRYRRY